MKQFIFKNKKSLAVVAGVLALGVVTMSFQDSPFITQKFSPQPIYEDTPKVKKKQTDADFDKAMKELEAAMQQFGEKMKELDMAKVNADISNAMKEIDTKKMMQDVSDALKEVDMKKIMEEVNIALKDVDTKKIMAEVNNALKEVDMKKINQEIKAAMKDLKIELQQINTEDIKKELEKAKQELEKSREELMKQKNTVTI